MHLNTRALKSSAVYAITHTVHHIDSPNQIVNHQSMRFNFGIVAVATLLSGVLGQSWPPCTENALGTECDMKTSPTGCCVDPNGKQAAMVCSVPDLTVSNDPNDSNGTWGYQTCPFGVPICWWSQDTGACCSVADGGKSGPNAFCYAPGS
jgi:hypothetical protein